MWKSFVAASGLVMALTTGATAQISGNSGPIQIEADRLDFLDREAKAIYLGNVDALQGDARIRAEKLTIFFEQNENAAASENGNAIGGSVGEVKSLLAEGTVYYMTPAEKARGDRGEYDYDSNTITLTGNVTVTRGENVIAGDKLVINVDTGVSTVSSNSTKRGERVRTVLITDSSNSTGTSDGVN